MGAPPTSRLVLDMSISVDGYVTGPDDGPDRGLGVGGERLHAWLGDGGDRPESHRPADEAGALVFDEALATGAVITGRRTYEHAGRWGGDHHGGVPVFVLTHHVPDEPPPGVVRYASDGITACAERARAAAAGRDVLVHGAAVGQEGLRAGVIDEIELHVVPVLLGGGRPLFDGGLADLVELELVRALDGPGVQHLRYRVLRAG